MFKNSMPTLVLPNFHTNSENCLTYRDSLDIDSNLPSLPPVSKWNYEDSTEYLSNIDLKNSVSSLISDPVIPSHIVSQYHTTQTFLNCSKYSLPTLPPLGDSGCLSLTDETSIINVKHSTSTPVHTLNSDNTPSTNVSTTTVSPTNTDSSDHSNEAQTTTVTPNKIRRNLPSTSEYCTVSPTTSINSSSQMIEQQNLRSIQYIEENRTPIVKQTAENKKICDIANSAGTKNIQQDEVNLDESHSDSELNLSSESVNRRNRADVKIQPYALRGNIEVFRCPLCSKDEIFSRGHLTNHLQDHQSNFKREDFKHVCCFCFSELSSNSSLERHLLTHTNHRPFNCNLCDKAFTTNGNLSRHVRTSHQVKVTNTFTPTTPSPPSAIQTVPLPGQQQPPALLPNWFQSPNSLHTSPTTNVYSKLNASFHSGLNGYQDTCHIQKLPVKQLEFNTYESSSSRRLHFQPSNDVLQKIGNQYTSTVNSFPSSAYSNEEFNVNIKPCTSNLSSLPSFSNEPVSVEQTKFTPVNLQGHRGNFFPNVESDSSYSENKNLSDWSTPYARQEEHMEDNANKSSESSSWPTFKANTTPGLLQFFSNYWLHLSKTGILHNPPHSGLDVRTIITGLLPSFLSGNNAANGTFSSDIITSSLPNDAGNIGEHITKYTSESPRITVCEIPPVVISEEEERTKGRFNDNADVNPQEYVVSSSPNPNIQNGSLHLMQPKFFNGINQYAKQKSRSMKLRTLKNFSVRYILAKRRKSLSVIEKRKQSKKVTEIKFKPLSPPCFSCKQEEGSDMLQFESRDEDFPLNESRNSHSSDGYVLTRYNSNDQSADYACSSNNLCNISDRRSPPILFSYNSDNNNADTDYDMVNIADQNYLQTTESVPEILDLSLRNKSRIEFIDSYQSTSELQTFGRPDTSLNYSDITKTPDVFTSNNTPGNLCSSYTTDISSQSTINMKPFNQQLDLNNILQDIYSLPRIQHNKTVPTSVNATNTTSTINKHFSILAMNLQTNKSNSSKLPIHSSIPPTIIQKKNSYKDAPKLITCPISGCNQKFPWNSSLKRHILTHTPHKPFACTRCTKSFSTKSNRERHMERVHRVSLKRQRQRFNQSNMSIQSPSSGDNRSELSGHHSNLNSVSRTTTGDNNEQQLDGIEELREDEILSMNSNEKQAEDISNSLLIRAGDPVVEPNPERLYNAALLAVANSTRTGFTGHLNSVSSPSINDASQSNLPTIPIRLRQSGRGGRRPRRSSILSMKTM
ncbi:unnamed protein product [Heterobilharzia americana]|nr:unnamed protein product [Heterobilharzia americana]